jgi:hypothetical protein
MAVYTVSPLSTQLDTQEIAREAVRIAQECRLYLFPERQRLTEIRLQLFERSNGRCELRRSPDCLDWVSWTTMRVVHATGRGGPLTLPNLRAACPECCSRGGNL